MPKDPVKLWKIGFGSVKGNNLLSVDTALIANVFLANAPQPILTYLYLTFNTLWTSMLTSGVTGKASASANFAFAGFVKAK